MAFHICGVYQVKIFELVTSFRDEDDLARSINGGIGDLEPGKYKDDIFPPTGYDMEKVLLYNVFFIGEESAGEIDFPVFVQGLVDVSYFDRNIKFCGGEEVLSDKLPANARDVCTTVNQGVSVDDF